MLSVLAVKIKAAKGNCNPHLRIPGSRQHRNILHTGDMVRPQDLLKWLYLSKVHTPSLHADIDLLISTNAPKLLEPWEVINSQGNGLYAVKTVLGWVVNGLLDGSRELEAATVTVNQIAVSKLEKLLMNQYNHDFCEKSIEKKEMSIEDQRFRNIMVTSTNL